jgi:hypothetical protein
MCLHWSRLILFDDRGNGGRAMLGSLESEVDILRPRNRILAVIVAGGLAAGALGAGGGPQV